MVREPSGAREEREGGECREAREPVERAACSSKKLMGYQKRGGSTYGMEGQEDMKIQRTTLRLERCVSYVLVSLILGGVLVMYSVGLASGDQWVLKSDIPTPRYMLAAVALKGKVYTIGGATSEALRNIEEYDPVTDTWTRKADMLFPRAGPSAAAVNGKIYAIGGNNPAGYVPEIEEYDPATDTWTKKASMPTLRRWLATCVVDGRIYAIGGIGGVGALSTVEVYDPAKDEWTESADMPTRRMAVAAGAVNGKIYAIGGMANWTGLSMSTVEEYDPTSNTWTRKADMPTARSQLTTPVVSGKIYAIGGLAGFDGVDKGDCFSAVEEYDPATDTWAKRADMPNLRYLLSSAVVNDRVYVMGGSSIAWPNTNFVPSVAEYTPPGQSIQGRN